MNPLLEKLLNQNDSILLENKKELLLCVELIESEFGKTESTAQIVEKINNIFSNHNTIIKNNSEILKG